MGGVACRVAHLLCPHHRMKAFEQQRGPPTHKALGVHRGADRRSELLVVVVVLRRMAAHEAKLRLERARRASGGGGLQRAQRLPRGAAHLVDQLHLHVGAHIDDELAPLGDDLLNRERLEVDREADGKDDHRALDARRVDFDARERTEADLLLVWVLREPRQVGATVDEALRNLEHEAGLALPARGGGAGRIRESDVTVERGRHEGELDTASHPRRGVGLPEGSWQHATAHAAIHLGRLLKFGKLDQSTVDAVDRRDVLVAARERCGSRREGRYVPAKHGVVLDEERARVEPCGHKLVVLDLVRHPGPSGGLLEPLVGCQRRGNARPR